MKKNKLVLAGLSVMVAVTLSCTSNTKTTVDTQSHEGHDHVQDSSANQVGNPEFKDENTKSVYDHYIHLKTAFVKTDAKEAQVAAGELNVALTKAGNSKGAELASKIASSADINVQRAQLDVLTVEVETLIKSTGLKSGKIFKQYCPMAKNGDGAFWLSGESAINNPYYGDEMLECGEVKEEIK